MHVITDGSQISVAAAVHKQGFVSATEEVAEKLVLAIEAISVSTQKPFHAGHQVGLGRFDDQMKVIGHQTIGVDLPIGLGTGLAKGIEEEEAIGIVAKDGFPAVAAVHEVVDRPFIFQPEFARHELNLQSAIKYVNTKNRPLSDAL